MPFTQSLFGIRKHASSHADGGSDEITSSLDWQSLPLGTILMWSGSIASIPTGWQLCDGTNGTPDLRDRFVVGAGNGYSVGDTGGEASHTLTISEMPAHHHMTYVGNNAGGGSTTAHDSKVTNFENEQNCNYTETVGGGQAHENRPPYYAICFIMRVSS